MDVIELEQSVRKWINEIFEEKPLPYEIQFLYFIIVEDKNSYHLEFAGSENISKFDFDYQPKYAEYFMCEYDDKLDEFIYKIKYLIRKFKLDKIIKNKIKLIYYSKNDSQFLI